MRHILLLLVTLLLLTACHTRDVNLGTRPYHVGDNLVVHADSLLLQEDRPMHWCQGVAETSDSLWIVHDNRIVVAAVTVIPEDCVDSVWVKVARDQLTMGWTHERDFLAAASPDDPISQAVRLFKTYQWVLITMSFILGLMALMVQLLRRQEPMVVHVHDIPSAYPTLFMTTLALAVILYVILQRTQPQAWQFFYFHPTLNPFSQPPLVGAFLCAIWALFLLAIAAANEAFQLLRPDRAVLYLCTLLGAGGLLYAFLHVLAQTKLFFPAGIAYILLAFYRYWHYDRPHYLCGQCHSPLQHKGRCPHCGAFND
ncbi:MAG: zinc ribbon domain-containing protein [Bacteroidaceae bacterium]|nr:zinc ribbon domain-containing protein [Bacteroidaceae bacterium]